MKKCLFKQAYFAGSFLKDFPLFRNKHGFPLPEIALIGRSNVGKSSLINHLLHQQRLAKVSSTPGKTKLINFFNIEDELILVDLPGYGFAKRSKKEQNTWSLAIDHYLRTSPSLKLLLLLLDLRHPLSAEDTSFLEWATYHKKPLLLIFTKSDKLSADERIKKLQTLSLPTFDHLYYSIRDGHSRRILIEKIHYFRCKWDN